ncbi:MAG TPA: ABC transporter substrate-binding protein, partial [Acidimicrobiia bacterium]|nr:ABC transporter substrate-binding protein [Acidimicrobiia bacterium]
QFCEDSDRVFAGTARDVGFDPVYRARTSLAQPDFTAECLSARNAGAQTFLVFLDSNSITRLAAACARQGYRPTFATASGLVQDRFKNDPNLAGLVAGTNVFPSFQSGTPATDEYQQAMQLFAGGRAMGEGPPLGWAAGKLLQRAAAGLPEPPTSQAILDGLWSMRDDSLGGLTAPLTFVRDQPIKPHPCWFTIAVAGGRFTSPDGFRQQCRPLPGG